MKKDYFSRQANWFSKEELNWCSTYVKEQWPEDTAHILKIAGEVEKNTFLFDLPWDMERTFEAVSYEDKVNWEKIPFGDTEYVYQLNRHRYFICLGQAYRLTRDEKYAKAFTRLLVDWILQEPLTEKNKQTVWRSIEAGIRGETWTKAILYFEECPELTDEFMELFKKSLRMHGEYLVQSYLPFKVSSNWGILENCGLYLIGSALGDDNYQRISMKRLEEEARTQIMGDGVHWEQSPMYHNEVLHCFMEVVRQRKFEGNSIPEFLINTVQKMGLANLAWKKPNHCQIAAGDSDETNLRDMLTHSAYLVSDGILKFGGYEKLDFESVWEFGKKGAEDYEKLKPRRPEQTDWMLEESGNYYLRSDWSEEGELLHFRNGALGGGHGHFDKLHVDLVLRGEDVLVDGGRYQYVFHKKRELLKSSRNHNCLLVDGEEYMKCLDSWTVNDSLPEIRQTALHKGGYTMVQGGHLGYIHIGKDVYCHRKVIRLEHGLYLLEDSFCSGSSHTYSKLFHFAPESTVELREQRIHFRGKKVQADFLLLDNNEKVEMLDSVYSGYYNEYKENQAVQVTKKSEGFCTMYTVISEIKNGEEPVKAEKYPVYHMLSGDRLEDNLAEGIFVQKADREYRTVFRHQDLGAGVDLIGNGGRKSLGKTVIYKNKDNGTVLEW